MSNQGESKPKTQLETGRGGSGRKGKTAIGAGNSGGGGYSDGTVPPFDWPDEPCFASKPRTVICVRDEVIRSGLKAMIGAFVSIIGEAADGMAALEMIRHLLPDLVILDVDLDVLNGVEVCRRLTSGLPNSNLLIFTDSYFATKYHNQLMRAGARGFCLISSGPRILFEAIIQVTQAQRYTDPNIAQLVKQTSATNRPSSDLTDREIEVLIRLDLRNKEIAEELDMKLRTVEKHIECILAKLKVPTRTAAALKAVQMGYVLLPKMPSRDPITGKSLEQATAEEYANEAIRRQSLEESENECLEQLIMNPSYLQIVAVFGGDEQTKAYKTLCNFLGDGPVHRDLTSRIFECAFHNHGFSLMFDRREQAFFGAEFYPVGREHFSDYKGDLPCGILLSDKQADILGKLGEPFFSGDARRALCIPQNPTNIEWEAFLERQGAEPITLHVYSFNVEQWQIVFRFDDDLGGQTTSISLSRKKVKKIDRTHSGE